MKNYERNAIVDTLNNHKGIHVKSMTVYIHRDNVGIKTLGKCDFLINHCGFLKRLCNDKQWNQIR